VGALASPAWERRAKVWVGYEPPWGATCSCGDEERCTLVQPAGAKSGSTVREERRGVRFEPGHVHSGAGPRSCGRVRRDMWSVVDRSSLVSEKRSTRLLGEEIGPPRATLRCLCELKKACACGLGRRAYLVWPMQAAGGLVVGGVDWPTLREDRRRGAWSVVW